MATHLCHNVTCNYRHNSSTFVPFVGLYIAGASLVCFILMLWDVVHGIRCRRLWLPCRKFSLNALTLTFVSTAAKLTMDITTPMPSAWDQLSKVTGTGFICVSMGFLLPSLGTNSASESVTNTGALSIFVVTVIFNICKQIYTGVIFSLTPEHIIIMVFMLAMVFLFWLSTLGSNLRKETQMDRNKDVFRDGKGSVTMLQRLQLCYLHGYNSDPQVFISRSIWCCFANVFCFFCFIVVLQVSVRTFFSHDFRYCHEVSVYGWSVRIIVATQILVILLASLTTSFRGAILYDQYSDEGLFNLDHEDVDGVQDSYPYLNFYNQDLTSICIKVLRFLVLPALFLLLVPGMFVISCYTVAGLCLKWKYLEPQACRNEYKQLLDENHMEIDDWTLTRCVDDIKRWTSFEAKSNPLSDLKDLLSKTQPFGESLEQLYSHYNFQERNKVSCLHLVFLKRIASASLPSSRSDHFTLSLNDEVFDIIHSVDTKINSSTFSEAKKRRLAKSMWMGQDFSSVVPGILEGWEAPSDLGRAVRIISGLKYKLPKKFIWSEVSFIMEFINIEDRSRYKTIEELFRHMEQLFVDMLHMFLMRIPEVIYKELTETPPEKYLSKVREAVELIYRVKSLEGIVQWSFPEGCNITCLMPASTADQHEDDGPV